MPANDDFTNFWKEEDAVPCNGCKTCCRGEEVMIKPEDGDDPAKYVTVPSIDPVRGVIVQVLAQKQNGDCHYLGENGCTIYEDRPAVCRFYDCRVAYLTFTRAMREMHAADLKFAEGKKRLPTLNARRRRAAIAIRKFRQEGGIPN